MPKVSVIVPVYNAQNALRRCLDSILNQEFKDLELIAVDDGSKDGSPEILDEYAAKDPRVIVVHKENSGVSDTRNKALELAQGEYIQFLDADDWITADSTKSLVRAMEENNVDLVVADFYRVVGENLSRKGSIYDSKVLSREEYAQWMMESPADYYYGVIWNKLYCRSIIREYGLKMDESLSFCEDFVFNLEYILHCKKIFPLQIPVYYYVKTDGSLVAQNLDLVKIVKMKTSIYEYYDKFFRNILDEKEYAGERINIARFLIAVANDSLAVPYMPGTKKLGEEKVAVPVNVTGRPDPIAATYYINKLFDNYLNTIALKYNLDLKDIRVFYALREAGRTNTQKDLTDFTGFTLPQVVLSLQKLALHKFITTKFDMNGVTASINDSAAELSKDIDDALKDYGNNVFAEFSEEERARFEKESDRVYYRIKQILESYEAQ
ncbi:MAG: glycosyltransferase [Erysipelotrichaceae bacterium]|nr:glycosyltransferase [Erysipelotrichaceae bacterium]